MDPSLSEAERMTFPPVPDDKVWCALLGKLVDATDCATDACVAPEMRPICWIGVSDTMLVRAAE